MSNLTLRYLFCIVCLHIITPLCHFMSTKGLNLCIGIISYALGQRVFAIIHFKKLLMTLKIDSVRKTLHVENKSLEC